MAPFRRFSLLRVISYDRQLTPSLHSADFSRPKPQHAIVRRFATMLAMIGRLAIVAAVVTFWGLQFMQGIEKYHTWLVGFLAWSSR